MKFDQTTTKPQFAFKEATRETPEFLGQTIVIVYLSIGVGFVVLLGALLICWGFGLPARNALPAGGIFMILCVLFSFWRIWSDELYMAVERITGHDLNQDGYIGAPPQVNEFNYQQSERTSWRVSLPAPEPVIRSWATAALNGGSLSYASWQKQFSTRPNYADGAERYREFRAALVQSGWAQEQGTHSINLTDRGEEALEEWLYQNPEPVPLLEGES